MPPIPTAIAEKRKQRRKALLIGLTYSKTSKRLQGEINTIDNSHRDTEELRDLLIEHYDYRPDDVTVMLDKEGYNDKLVPRHMNMRRELQNLVEGAEPGDSFFLYYAGHTEQIDNNGGTEEDNKDEVMLAEDYAGAQHHSCQSHERGHKGMILDDKLRIYLVNRLPVGARLTAVFDSCHSGTLLDLEHYACNNRFPWLEENDQKKELMKNVRNDDMVPCALVSQDERLSETVVERRDSVVSQGKPSSKKSRGSISIRSMSLKAQSRQNTTEVMPSFGEALDGLEGFCQTMETVSEPEEIDNFPRCSSPAPIKPPCNGHCVAEHPISSPVVVSVSACADAELAWDGGGTSMTKMLIEMLRKNRDITLQDVMSHLSERLSEHVTKMNKDAQGLLEKLKSKGHTLTSSCARCEKIGKNYCGSGSLPDPQAVQVPKLGSTIPLNLNQPLIPRAQKALAS